MLLELRNGLPGLSVSLTEEDTINDGSVALD
jgi:hypothetical protein